MIAKSTYQTRVLAEGFRFLEGPRWRDGKLWMSDMLDGNVHTLTPDGTTNLIADVPAHPSGIGFLPDGTPLIVSMQDHRLLRLEDGKLVFHCDLGPWVTGLPNDMVVDRHGRAYVGNFGFDLHAGEEMRPANIVMVDEAGDARVVADDLAFPNGTVISADGKRLIVAETFGRKLSSFDIAPDGTLSNRAVFANLGDYTPDGICLDQECAVWVSAYRQGEFLRVLEGGTITDRIDVGNRHAVACQLGGNDGRTLFCLTCELGTFAEIQSRRSARVEVALVDVSGAGSP